ncbi:MAG: hypothetical protein ACP5D9_02820 [Mariniphaga sp.]
MTRKRSINWLILNVVILLICISNTPGFSQPLDSDNRVSVTLDDGTEVTLYGKANTRSNTPSGDYFYLPTGLRLSKRLDGVPEFLFMKYTTEEETAAGGVQGGLLHFLMEWGLTAQQETELLEKLKAKLQETKNRSPFGLPLGSVPTNIKIMGPVDVEPLSEESFQIASASLSDPASSTVIQSGRAPSMEGGKAVVASKMDKETAQMMATSFEETSSIADLSVTLGYQYRVLLPAIEGSVVIDWSRVSELVDSLSTEYMKKKKTSGHLWWKKTKTTYSYEELHEIYSKAQENKAVTVTITDRSLGDETSAMVLESFMSYFTNALTDREMDIPPVPAEGDDEDGKPVTQKGNYYTLNQVKREKKIEKGRETISLNYRRSVPKFIDLTGNLRSWYNNVRDNPNCVTSVNLNDPFFQHRHISFILDMEAEEMFSEVINYVTVSVRKKRSSGNDFSDRFTMDKKYINEKGTSAIITYARGEDTNPDAFEYKAQWSLRGGKVYPDNPEWQKGSWEEAVTLAPPVTYRKIEFEADLDDLKEKQITRVTAQVRYLQFGKEEEENIHISPVKGEPLVEKNIFIDNDTKGYAYRLILTHKTEGKLVFPWEVRMNDDYIYATLPEELQNTESEVFKEAKQEAGNLATKAKEKVLDKFDEIFK